MLIMHLEETEDKEKLITTCSTEKINIDGE